MELLNSLLVAGNWVSIKLILLAKDTLLASLGSQVLQMTKLVIVLLCFDIFLHDGADLVNTLVDVLRDGAYVFV